MIELISIGQSLKPHGKEGKMKVFVEEKYEEDLSSARALFFNLNGSKVPFIIEKIDFSHQVFIKLDEVDTPEDASLLAQTNIYLDKSEVKHVAVEENDVNIQDLQGFKVFDKSEVYLGTVTSVIENAHQDLLELESPENTFLVPFHIDFIVDIFDLEGRIVMDLPEGLTSL